jgi:N-acetyl-anhydromuramyl-L-alanine amidase AmpD
MKKSILLSWAVLSSTTAMASDITEYPSENCVVRTQGMSADHLVLHCVGMTEDWVLTNFSKSGANGGLGVSSNYYIPPKGDKTYRFVPDSHTAYHAGVSEWHGRAAKAGLKGLNQISLGIEVGCENYGHFEGNTYFPYSFRPYSPDAIQRGLELSTTLLKTHGIKPENVVWHSDISPFRMNGENVILGKTDPGATFPGKYFAEHGVGVWPEEDRIQDAQLSMDLDGLLANLEKIGFCFDRKDKLQTSFAVQAFIMHYVPGAIKWDEFAKLEQGNGNEPAPVWDGTITEDIAIRAANLAAGSFLY